MKQLCRTIEETEELAKKLAINLQGGEIIGLVGELGSGKTTFAKALAKSLGVKSRVASPTFVLMKVYKAKLGKIRHLVHIDAYRLDDGLALEQLGAKDYWSHPDTVTIIEWADRIKKVLPKSARQINFRHSPRGRLIIYKED